MTKFRILFLVCCVALWSCGAQNSSSTEPSKYLRWVGDIPEDPTLDDPTFQACSEDYILQYHNIGDGFQYNGEMSAIREVFDVEYKVDTLHGESGWIRVRHVVNCEGQAGRFRLLEGGFDYQTRSFDKTITDQIMQITKGLDGWIAKKYEGNPVDYYQYLIFKIEDGQIIEIGP